MFLIEVILAVTFANRFTDILDTMLEEIQYQNVVSESMIMVLFLTLVQTDFSYTMKAIGIMLLPA